MRIKHVLTSLALLTLSASAQNISNGFYRVQNYGSKRYIYVKDNTGSINVQTTSADMGAIRLYNDANLRFDDPSSVIYAENHGTYQNTKLYDLRSQGTGVYQIIGYYVAITNTDVAGTYWVVEPQHSIYLWDGVGSTRLPQSYLNTETLKDYPKNKYWSITPVDSKTNEYLGITPNANIKVAGKYYKPYYVGFPMNLASSGMKAYYVSDVKADAVIIREVVGTVPAATPVIIECTADNATGNRVDLLSTTVSSIQGNKLSGNYFCFGSHSPNDRLLYNPSTMRVLAVKDGRLHYITDTNHEHTKKLKINDEEDYYIADNESYLRVPAGTAATLPVMTQAEYDALHPAGKAGDINGDGKINATDVVVLNRYIAAGKQAKDIPAADINGDGKINSTDVVVLNRYIATGK